MSRQHFGTDGVRGIVGDTLTLDLVERLGERRRRGPVAGESSSVVTRAAPGPRSKLPSSRASSPRAGSRSAAASSRHRRSRLLAQDLGIVLSASHNPPEYNGVKFFTSEGHKLSDLAGGGDRSAPRRPGARAWLGRDRRGRGRRLRRAHSRALRLRPHRPADRGRLCERRLLRDRARRLRAARGTGDDRRRGTRRVEHQRRLRRDGSRPPPGGRSLRRLRSRDRVRRRRRSDARRRRDRERRWTAIRSSPSSPSRWASTPSR